MTPPTFSYEAAFNRNIGWVTEFEQQTLRAKRIAIAGMGGVGGFHLTTLARLGIGAFHIADFDRFELANFNRQIGATMETIGQPKVDVLASLARQINPELEIVTFPAGVSAENLDAFLGGVDLFIDGLDFFVLDLRRRVFARCADLGIPAITAAPLGMGTAFLVFRPGGMSFERYFCLEGLPLEKQYVNFLLGLAPRGLHRRYLVDPSRVDLRGQRGPSTVAACELCAGVTAIEAVKLLVRRGRVRAAPYYHQFDPYRSKLAVGRLPFGNRSPQQRIKLSVAYRAFERLSRRAVASIDAEQPMSEMERILDTARWAPSGDNIQPWRFEIRGPETVAIRLQPSGVDDIYEYLGGEPTLLSGGTLLETLRIAASAVGRALDWEYEGCTERGHSILARMPKSPAILTDSLHRFIWARSVDRRRYRRVPLSANQEASLVSALGEGLTIEWWRSVSERWRAARLNASATDIRLRIPEAFAVHQRVIDWERDLSPSALPGAAVGLNPLSRRITRWLMRDWRRARIANQLGATRLAQLEMDLIPGLFSAAHFRISALIPQDERSRVISLLRVGQAIQRFWLTATREGLVVQPNLAPLCFGYLARNRPDFTADARLLAKARSLAPKMGLDTAQQSPRVVFMGRLGIPVPRAAVVRSVRLSLKELLAGPDHR